MNAQVQPRRRAVAKPNPPSSTLTHERGRADHQPLADPANEHFFEAPHREERVDPLWMITVAGALLFLFLAVNAALG